MTDDTITFGFLHGEGQAEFGQSIGREAQPGSTERQIEVVVKAVNDAGGIGGRKIRLLTYPFRAGQPIDTQLQAACDHFTRDNKSFAVSSTQSLGSSGVGEVIYECLARAGVAYIEHTNVGDTKAYDRHPGIAYAPATLNADRAVSLMIDALAEADWFGSKPVIGVHSLDTPHWRRLFDEVVEPRLAARGYAVREKFFFRVGPSGPEFIGEYETAVLRFKGAGVTHVLNVGSPPSFFAQAAESQDWRPKWSVYSELAPSFWYEAVPPEQLAGSLGVGWSPVHDLPPTDRGPAVNRAAVTCEEIMRAAGEDTTPAVTWHNQLTACTSVFFLKEALEAAPEISIPGLAAGKAALGTSHLSPATWTTRFLPNRRDGAAAYRMLGFVDECRCYRYVSERREIP